MSPAGVILTHTLTNSRWVVPVFPAGMIAATCFLGRCLLAGLTFLLLLSCASLVAWCTQADQVVVVVRATQFDRHYVVYLDGLALASPVTVLALPIVAFENVRTNC
ncbi:hypothetical protein AU188_03935 [Mycobacterium sp. IS-3022]|nr:hypothetical protein AU188_03935 [Mycobacterium sp. IS-3022]